MDCLICMDRDPYKDSLMCGGCFQALRSDVYTLVGAHTWLGIAMLNPTPAFKAGTIHRAAGPKTPFRLALLDARTDIAGKLGSWARLIAEEHRPALAGPADAELGTVAAWLDARLPWVSDQPWCDDMAHELRDAARQAYGLVPWGRVVRELPLPCPGCGLLTLAQYGGTDSITCRNRECGGRMIWADYEKAVHEKHAELTTQQPEQGAAA